MIPHGTPDAEVERLLAGLSGEDRAAVLREIRRIEAMSPAELKVTWEAIMQKARDDFDRRRWEAYAGA